VSDQTDDDGLINARVREPDQQPVRRQYQRLVVRIPALLPVSALNTSTVSALKTSKKYLSSMRPEAMRDIQ
jgi:hypothetical protein